MKKINLQEKQLLLPKALMRNSNFFWKVVRNCYLHISVMVKLLGLIPAMATIYFGINDLYFSWNEVMV
jgi:hypothetical protein